MLCYKMCIYDFNWLYCLFFCDENLIPLLHLKSFVLLGVLKWRLVYEGAFTHLCDAVNKTSVINVQCLYEIHSWKNPVWLGS